MAALDHPNVVPLYAAGEEDGTVYIVTRWIEGTELGALIHRDGPLEPGRAARTAAQIAAALETAHEKGLVHRDVKPSNVILDLRRSRLPDRLRAGEASRDRGRADRGRPDARNRRLRCARADRGKRA